MKASYSKTIKTLSILGLCFVCAIQAEEPESPALKILEFHGIRATDPGGRMGLRNPERGGGYEVRIGNALREGNNHMDWIRATCQP